MAVKILMHIHEIKLRQMVFGIILIIHNADLYQIAGAQNGVPGRFEWIVQDGKVTQRMFISGGTMNGAPIKP